jgi:Mn2+/Fe2+ NRAMP family transporter
MASVLQKFLKRLGPGFITGASDDDPSGIATYTTIGAQFGLGQLWLVVFLYPLMTAVQEMSARIGMVAGDGVTAVLRQRYSKTVLWLFVTLLLVVNTVNIGTDLGAMADSAHLILPSVPFPVFLLGFTFFILVLEIFLTYKAYANVLKWFCLSLFSYVVTAFCVTTDWRTVLLHAVVPHIELTRAFLFSVVAMLGATMSPYLFIWQAHEEIEEEVAEGRDTKRERRGATALEVREMRKDTAFGMGFSQLITFFIITTAAMTFFRSGLHDIQTSADAARALEPLAGRFASLLFAAGIIGTGLLAVPVLSASASYAVADAFGWSEGLYRKFREAHGFYGVITVSTLVGLLINFSGISAIRALYWTAILSGFITPFMIAIMMAVANNKAVMGKHVNHLASNILCGIAFLASLGAAIILFVL